MIVSAVLLILVVVIIGAVIQNFSHRTLEKYKSESEGFSFYYDAELYVLSELATLPPSGGGENLNNLELGVRRVDNEEDVKGIRFIFEDNSGNFHSYDIYDNPPNNAGIIESYNITSENSGITDFSKIEKISVRLLYGNDKATEVLDVIEIN